MSQSENQPAAQPTTAKTDRIVPLVSMILLVLTALASGSTWLGYTKFELERRREELQVEAQPHLKHDYTFKVLRLSAPTKDTPGKYRIAFTAKFDNTGKFPFKVREAIVTPYLGRPKKLLANESKLIPINVPNENEKEDDFLTWASIGKMMYGEPFVGSVLYPTEQGVIYADFIAIAQAEAYVAVECYLQIHVYPEPPDKPEPIVWRTSRCVSLSEAEWPNEHPVTGKND